jgi:hypothetical protein
MLLLLLLAAGALLFLLLGEVLGLVGGVLGELGLGLFRAPPDAVLLRGVEPTTRRRPELGRVGVSDGSPGECVRER